MNNLFITYLLFISVFPVKLKSRPFYRYGNGLFPLCPNTYFSVRQISYNLNFFITLSRLHMFTSVIYTLLVNRFSYLHCNYFFLLLFYFGQLSSCLLWRQIVLFLLFLFSNHKDYTFLEYFIFCGCLSFPPISLPVNLFLFLYVYGESVYFSISYSECFPFNCDVTLRQTVLGVLNCCIRRPFQYILFFRESM